MLSEAKHLVACVATEGSAEILHFVQDDNAQRPGKFAIE
jgi:hypothetical protein